MKFCTKYNHRQPVTRILTPSMTEAQYKNDCDINTILKRMSIGQAPAANPQARYGDFSDFGDFFNCLQRVEQAKSDFAALPSDVRDRFGNSPQAFMEFVLDSSNVDECVRLGLRVKAVHDETAEEILKDIRENVTRKGVSHPNENGGAL